MVAEIRKSVREKTAKKGRKTKRGREELILIKKQKNKPLIFKPANFKLMSTTSNKLYEQQNWDQGY